jgi:hypothetical protein
VTITACLLGITLLGLQFWIDLYEALLGALGIGGARFTGAESAKFLVPWQALGLALGTVLLLNGKRLTGVVGLFVPLVAIIGVVGLRLGRGSSREPTVTK